MHLLGYVDMVLPYKVLCLQLNCFYWQENSLGIYGKLIKWLVIGPLRSGQDTADSIAYCYYPFRGGG